MICETCHGFTPKQMFCQECHGTGIMSCCDTGGANIDKWFTEPISERLKDASVLIVSTKFDKDGNLVEIKTLLDQKPDGTRD